MSGKVLTHQFNCLLELNILVDEVPSIFFRKIGIIDKHYDLYDKKEKSIILKMGVPQIVYNNKFKFRNDIFCHFIGHKITQNPNKKIVLIRDPRDTIYSTYKAHHQHDYDFLYFVKHYHIQQCSHWGDYIKYRLRTPNTFLVKFEDLKLNGLNALRCIMELFGLKYEDHVLQQALDNSTTAKAKEAEKFHLQNTDKNDLIKHGVNYEYNRDGSVAQYKKLTEHQEAFDYLVSLYKNEMRILGYEI